ncbi:MAG: alanine racemase [Anaerolineales bacterium]|nr:alanine racemase [Anaerolineales bacterium]
MNLTTPALVVDIEIFEANQLAIEKMFAGTGKFLRPHFKTHRTPQLASRQQFSSLIGFTCSTVGEVEVLVEAGFKHILLANEIVTQEKINQLAELARGAELIVAVDSLQPLRDLSKACQLAGSTIGIVIDVDIGLGRCGVEDPESALALAREAISLRNIRFRGLMGYEGRIRAKVEACQEKISQAYAKLTRFKQFLESQGIPIEIVSAAGTSTLPEALRNETITEIQAGTYCLMEPDLLDLNLPFKCAVWVVGTVISCRKNRIVLDVGRRTVSSDYGYPIPECQQAKVVALNDEHTIIEWNNQTPKVGEKVLLRPTQNRTTFNLYDFVWLVRGGEVIDRLPITARGRS